MSEVLAAYAVLLSVVRVALFVAAVAAAVIALVDWAVRTRRINPFSGIARFFRARVDPLMVPVERRVIARGGKPSSAPWWMVVVVVVGGILLLALLQFVGRLLGEIAVAAARPALVPVLLLSWAFGLLRLALIVRVVSSWIAVSPFSRWIRWSFVLTEWMLAPLRRVIPTLGPIDITPLVAYFGLLLLQGALGIR